MAWRTGALVLLMASLSACGSGGAVKRVSRPAANIQQLTVRADGSWSVELRLDNFSSVPMRFDTIRLALVVDGQAAGTLQAAPGLAIGPEAADVATAVLSPAPGAKLAVADALAARRGVGYTLEGEVTAAPESGGARDYAISQSNALSPVPGLPGVLR